MAGSLPTSNYTGLVDGLAISASTLCLVHCLALPLLMSSLPVLGLIAAHDELVHSMLLLIATPLALWALTRGLPFAGPWPRRVGTIGLALMTAALVISSDTQVERWLTTTGVILLAGAHAANWRLGSKACRSLRAAAVVDSDPISL